MSGAFLFANKRRNQMTPEQLSVLILAIVGAALQLIFRYFPAAANWYQAQANKGPLMLAFVAVTGGILFALSCTPYAAQFGISLACETATIFTLLKAIFIVATSQQLVYLYTRNTAKK
jgi:hypothetical protein